MRRFTILVALLALVVVSAAPALGKGNDKNFTAHLNGGNEVPPVDTQAQGQAKFKVSEDGQSIEYKLIVANIDEVTQAHIHLAPEGETAPPVVFLFGLNPDGVTTNGVLAEGSFDAGDLFNVPEGTTIEDLVDDMNSGNAYVNVHTLDHPPGEIRGQIK